MLTRVDVGGDNPIQLPIAGIAPRNSLHLRKIEGLDPPGVDLFLGDYARDGGYYQGRRVGVRNVVFTIDIHPNPALGETVSGWRDILYRTFLDPRASRDDLQLTFHDDLNRELFLRAHTEKFECDIFSKDTFAQISTICPDPYIRATVPTILTPPVNASTYPFTYNGGAEVGVEMEIFLTGSTPTLIVDLNGEWMRFDHPEFAMGKIVYINTLRGGFRGAWMMDYSTYQSYTPSSIESNLSFIDPTTISSAASLRVYQAALAYISEPTTANKWNLMVAVVNDSGGLGLISILPALKTGSTWLELGARSNLLKIYGATKASTPAYLKTLSYRSAYWGL